MKTSLLILAVAVLMMTCNSQAGLGWSLDECIQHYGGALGSPKSDANGTAYGSSAKGYVISVWINGGKVSRVGYSKSNLSTGEVQVLLSANAPDAVWDDQPTKDEANNQFWWKARRNGVVVTSLWKRTKWGIQYWASGPKKITTLEEIPPIKTRRACRAKRTHL